LSHSKCFWQYSKRGQDRWTNQIVSTCLAYLSKFLWIFKIFWLGIWLGLENQILHTQGCRKTLGESSCW
jgi:hypothetical protein